MKSHCTAKANGRSWKTVGEKTLLEAGVRSKSNVNVKGVPVQQGWDTFINCINVECI